MIVGPIPSELYMRVRPRAVTRRAMSWSFILMSLLLPAQRVDAQTVVGVISEQRMGAAPDSAHMAAVMAAAQRMRSPATFALSMQKELSLSAQQVASLEVLVRAESDSQATRTFRMMQQMQARSRDKAALAGMASRLTWTGPIDEAAIRASACEQSKMQAEIFIGMIQDRHAVGELLTTTQREELDRLQRELMTGASERAVR